MPSAATTLAAVCLATAASQGLTNAQSDPAPIVLAELPMQADADTSLFRILGGMGPGTTCPDTHKCGEFHLKCPGEAPGYAVTDWNTATSELRTKVAEGKVVNMEGEVVERQNCGDSPLCGLVGGDHETVVSSLSSPPLPFPRNALPQTFPLRRSLPTQQPMERPFSKGGRRAKHARNISSASTMPSKKQLASIPTLTSHSRAPNTLAVRCLRSSPQSGGHS